MWLSSEKMSAIKRSMGFEVSGTNTTNCIEKKQPTFERVPSIIMSESHSLSTADDLFFRFINHFHYRCENNIRLGLKEDGGWNVCQDGPYQLTKPCLVYSFGINFDFSFDDDISKKYNCTVRSFDPSMRGVTNHRRDDNIWFYDIGLSGVDNQVVANKNWKMKTFRTIVEELGDSNKTVDYLKFDVEGSEWAALETMLKSNILQSKVKQLAFEIHIHAESRTATGFHHFWKLLDQLEHIGFGRWYWHLNNYGSNGYTFEGRTRSACYEMVYINTAFLKEDY